MECGINPLKLNAVFITHLHGDHLYGLFPLVSTLGLLGRKTPLDVFAPAPLGELMDGMNRLIGDGPAFEVRFHQVDTRAHAMVYENKVMEVWTVPLRHRVPTAGYLFREKRPAPNVRKEKIEHYGLDIAQIVAAKRGRDITLGDGRIIPNSELTYIPYEPRSYAYCTDTMPSGKVASLVEGVDMLYHEATFAAADKALAKATGHSTSVQAAEVAQKAGVERLLIGHFSGRYKDVAPLMEEARAVFPATEEAVEGREYEIPVKRNY
jgi:ribonuclease Z